MGGESKVIFLALVLLAGLLGAVDIFRSHGQNLAAWGVLVLAIAGLIDKGVL
jgi:hypothetical protein